MTILKGRSVNMDPASPLTKILSLRKSAIKDFVYSTITSPRIEMYFSYIM